MAFFPFHVVARENGRLSETWRVVGGEYLEITNEAGRSYSYRWFDRAQLFAYCNEGLPKPFFVASADSSAASVFEAARKEGLDICSGTTVLRISGGRVAWSDSERDHVKLVDLSGMTLTRQDRSAIRMVGKMETLVLSKTNIVDVDLAYLSGLASLTNLALDGTAVTDNGLKYILRLPLRQIDLSSTAVTDSGLVTLGGVRTLRLLYLKGTTVTSAAVDSLKEQLPEISVQR